jgi:nucleotide-binding universal stress UspA family protein
MKMKPSLKPGEVLMESKPGDLTALGCTAATALPTDSLIKWRTILVPVDFSECSKQALACAVPFARQFGARLELVHVVAPYYAFDPNGMDGYQQGQAVTVAAAKQGLIEQAEAMVPQDLRPGIQVRCGRIITEIANAASEVSADLIIISTHGYTGFKHVAFGSTAEGVVRLAPCPVLTVRAKATGPAAH